MKEGYDELFENAELYMKDAESFLAEGQDELAMLSIGYAEGLIDSLTFTGQAQTGVVAVKETDVLRAVYSAGLRDGAARASKPSRALLGESRE